MAIDSSVCGTKSRHSVEALCWDALTCFPMEHRSPLAQWAKSDQLKAGAIPPGIGPKKAEVPPGIGPADGEAGPPAPEAELVQAAADAAAKWQALQEGDVLAALEGQDPELAKELFAFGDAAAKLAARGGAK